ncbi:hypothetical protein ACG2LH_03105 [Zhouia sp. PK063]|uniref:hypothetical protein n=1 Tax=Zhouia sp. PK063 TaxID=3373602 RepID=UPI0037B4B881
MNELQAVKHKLNQFITKYYRNELIKGVILFLTLGLLYFLFTLFVESLFWLSPLWRTILFWCFVGGEALLVIAYIIFPLTKIFRLSKGISLSEAAELIGKHFKEVDDKLINILQLENDKQTSDLLFASIAQKSKELQPIKFTRAIDYTSNLKYIKYLAVPVIIVLVIVILGKTAVFSASYNRVVHHDIAYEQPAPFQFFILNDNLNVQQQNDFTLKIQTVGEVQPEQVKIHYADADFYATKDADGFFSYTFSNVDKPIAFYITANTIQSKEYTLNTLRVPEITNFKMHFHYPSYLQMKDDEVANSGNATIPEGTTVLWKLKGNAITTVQFFEKDTIVSFQRKNEDFYLKQSVKNNLNYAIASSNNQVKNFQKLGYQIRVIKDEYPKLALQSKEDSTTNQVRYFLGNASDDHGIKSIQLICYPTSDPNKKQNLPLSNSNSNSQQFAYAFPNNLNISLGEDYQYYFEVTDNDGVNGGKRTTSSVFNYHKFSKSESEEEQLNNQKESIDALKSSFQKMDKEAETRKELSDLNKQKTELNFNEKRKLKEFFKQQSQSQQILEEQSKKFKNELSNFDNEAQDQELKKLLQERLERQEAELKKNAELMKKLSELSDKMKNEELSQRLNQIAKQQANSKRNLQQLLELTKRFYVNAKLEKIKNDLQELSNRQDKLSQQDQQSLNDQQKLTDQFEQIKKHINEVKSANNELQKPINLDIKDTDKREVDDAQKKAEQDLQEQQSPVKASTKKQQKNAADKMEEMSQKLQQQMQSSASQSQEEDAEMLRQILDNLLVFSFKQEDVMKDFVTTTDNSSSFSKNLKTQNELRDVFKHVDDSIFSLSLRHPEMAETVNQQITNVYDNIDQALLNLADNKVYLATSQQQYALTATNNLADMLSDVLDNMQQNMNNCKASGSGQSFQLPDIIKSQQELNKQMQEGMQKGEKGKSTDGEKRGEGSSKKGEANGGEKDAEMLYDIYKKQQELRFQLQGELKKSGFNNGESKSLLDKMEGVENKILNDGMKPSTLDNMKQLEHQLLKLNNAAFTQGKDSERESKTNTKQFTNPVKSSNQVIKDYFPETELLNRQALPLRQFYKIKIQEYFNSND